jgi:hypothetical protein
MPNEPNSKAFTVRPPNKDCPKIIAAEEEKEEEGPDKAPPPEAKAKEPKEPKKPEPPIEVGCAFNQIG